MKKLIIFALLLLLVNPLINGVLFAQSIEVESVINQGDTIIVKTTSSPCNVIVLVNDKEVQVIKKWTIFICDKAFTSIREFNCFLQKDGAILSIERQKEYINPNVGKQLRSILKAKKLIF